MCVRHVCVQWLLLVVCATQFLLWTPPLGGASLWRGPHQSAIGAQFVKPLIPGHIPASFLTLGRARAAKTGSTPGSCFHPSPFILYPSPFHPSSFTPLMPMIAGGAYIAPFAMCASLGNPASRRTHGKHRHVCATQFVLWRPYIFRTPDQSAMGAQFVKPLIPGHIPASFPNGWALAQPKPASGGHTSRLLRCVRASVTGL